MTSQRNFAWSSLILNGLSAGKKLTNPCVIFNLRNMCFAKGQKTLRFLGENLAVCLRIRLCVTGQHDL